jgi:hypothetical protein
MYSYHDLIDTHFGGICKIGLFGTLGENPQYTARYDGQARGMPIHQDGELSRVFILCKRLICQDLYLTVHFLPVPPGDPTCS